MPTIRVSHSSVVTENSLLAAHSQHGTLILMNWRSIRLELGSTGDFPLGSVSRTFLVRLPLDDHDAVDEAALFKSPSRATVRRHWSTEPDERGVVVPSGDDWELHCDGKPPRILRLNGTPVRLGLRVSITEPDGTELPLKIASIR